ncbi:hypothetical protein Gogos_010398 [Gossypium gossypioides]|uniref:DUF4283 domain-containing protein n=1 Tax=Gossypium gossypioides TaxID=34282 RepID=A0A7J9BL68_GOSGO|nr:hypothetical protein [Gossypium gossypioides]
MVFSGGWGDYLNEDSTTKKMSFNGLGEDMSVDIVMDLSLAPALSWKAKLLGRGVIGSKDSFASSSTINEEDPDFMEEDIMRSIVNGMSVIDFFERIQQILVKDMVNMVVVKLLGWNIEYATLHNKIFSLWSPSYPFQLMDVKNGYFLIKFHSREDYDMVFTQVCRDSSTSGEFWRKITALVGKVAKLDFKTDNELRGWFAQMAVYIRCIKDLCPTTVAVLDRTIEMEATPMSLPTGERTMEMAKAFRPLMLVKRKPAQTERE